MRRRISGVIFVFGLAVVTLILAPLAHTEPAKQDMGGIFDHIRFTYEGKPRHVQSIVGDEVVKMNLPPAIVEAFKGAGGPSFLDQMELEVGLYGDAHTKAVTVEVTPPTILRHYDDASSPIARGYSARWGINWMWATGDVKAGVAGNLEGTIYEDGEAKHFQIPLLIEAEASDEEPGADGRSYHAFVAMVRWGSPRLTDVAIE